MPRSGGRPPLEQKEKKIGFSNFLRVMLAVQHDKVQKFPDSMYMSEKVDGIRCVTLEGLPLSRTMKVIPNKHVQKLFKEYKDVLDRLDGELVVGYDFDNPEVSFRKTSSAIMSEKGEPDFTYFVFDWIDEGCTLPWYSRYKYLLDIQNDLPEWCKILPHYFVEESKKQDNPLKLPVKSLHDFENEILARGAEGVMLRDTHAPYVKKRVTPSNPYLIKVKRFVDQEYKIVGYEEMLHNENEATINELGYTERSTKKEGMQPAGILGALVLETENGVQFRCGSGFTLQDRHELWKQKDSLIGKYAKIKYFPQGAYDVPRFPVYAGIRSEIDM